MTNETLKTAINAYRRQDLETFAKAYNDLVTTPGTRRTIIRQAQRMLENIDKPRPQFSWKKKQVPQDVLDSLKNSPRTIRRRFSSTKKDPNGSILQDKKGSITIRDRTKEYNFIHHATKGYRLKSRTFFDRDQEKRDSGYSALILPDLTDKATMDMIAERNRSEPRLAVTNPDYFKKQNVPGGIRRCQTT